MEELCSPGSPQGTRDRRDTNKLCRPAFPKSRHLDKSFGLFFFHFPSSFLFFSFFFFKACGQAKEPVLSSCLHSFPNDPSGNHKPQILHNSHALFLPCKMDTADFHIRFPSLETKQHKKGKVGFLSNSPFNVKSGQRLWRDQSRTAAKLQL